jgi:hypothetical protein
MANHHRGEIDAELNGEPYTLCLTLGALAELEASFGDQDMLALAKRFESGRLSARDAIRILGAGLRGAGHDVSDAQVAAMKCDAGAAGMVRIVAGLLEATFGSVEAAAGSTGDQAGRPGEEPQPPFPGRG